jgi:hypothetical protein
LTELALKGINKQNSASFDFSAGEGRKRIISSLLDLSLLGLEAMYLPGEGLFCHRRILTDDGMKNEGASIRYTIITLLGLDKAHRCGLKVPFDVQRITERLLDRAASFDSTGDLGLLLWLVAQALPDRIDLLIQGANIRRALKQSREVQKGLTTELSWLLSGLCQVKEALGKEKPEMAGLPEEVYALIRDNYGGRGIFRHMGRGTLAGQLRGRFGCFADQVYPIEAFSNFWRVYGDPGALKIAQECADMICRLQGRLGQWWWHYDATSGRVVGRYPVYSVHQDGMAPMALFAIGSASGQDYSGPIYKGLEWITGRNELGVNLVEERERMIWRSFYQGKTRKYAEAALSLAQLHFPARGFEGLMILQECRPYHLGWLLYAFADKI